MERFGAKKMARGFVLMFDQQNLHNFRKMTLMSQAIDKVMSHVDVRYWFTEVPEIRRFIQHQEKTNRLSADQAHALSLQIQARGT